MEADGTTLEQPCHSASQIPGKCSGVRGTWGLWSRLLQACTPASLQAVRSCRVCRSVQYGSDALLRSCLLLWDNPIAAREGAGELEARPAEGVHSEGMTSFHCTGQITSRSPSTTQHSPPQRYMSSYHLDQYLDPAASAQLSTVTSLCDCNIAVHFFRRILQSTEDFMDYPDLSPSRAR